MITRLSSLLVCALAMFFVISCVSPSSLPQSAAEVNFESVIEGKTGWSKYEESARFDGVGLSAAFDAAKVGLGQARFSLISVRRDHGTIIGEHGMTAHDWNVVAGVYLRESAGGCDVKVIVEGSKDLGFGGDTTGDAWTTRILDGLRSSLRRNAPSLTPSAGTPKTKSTGTGFFVTADGWILTAFHVVEGASKIEVIRPDGQRLSAKIVRSQPALDLALLEVNLTNEVYLPIPADVTTSLGDSVFTIGYPATAVLGSEPKYTDGAISSLSGLGDDASIYQITVPVQPGNSGGPLVNDQGEAVGVVVSSVSPAAFLRAAGALPQKINFAVRTEFARSFLRSRKQSEMPRTATRGEAIERTAKSLVFIVADP